MKGIRIVSMAILLILLGKYGFSQNIIEGRVTDKATGAALPYATVYLPEQKKGTLTDTEGHFKLTSLPAGKCRIQFSYMGYKTLIRSIADVNKQGKLNITMERGALQAEEVVISGGTYTSQHENAIKIELLKSEALLGMGAPTINQALSQVAGVDMIAKGNGVAKPVIRGLSMNNILMLNNGVKLENFQFSENHPFVVDEFGADRIEIIKGPASLLYGSDAVGGVINVIKEKPAPTGSIVGDYQVQTHTNTRGIATTLGVRGSNTHFFWGIRGGVKSHRDYEAGNGQEVPNTRFNEESVKLNVGVNRSFGVFRLYYDYNAPELGMSVARAFPLIDENKRENNVWYQDLTNHVLSARNTLFFGGYKIDINAAYQMNNRKLQTDEGMPAFEMVDMDMNTLSYEVKTYFPSSIGSEYILGVQGDYRTNRNNEAPNHVLPDADANNISIFGLVQNTFGGNVKAQAGVRYDFRTLTTEAEPTKEAIDADYANVSASAGLTWHVAEHLLLRTNVATAYRTPNIAELTQNGMHGNRYEQGNPELSSQHSYEGDLSAHFHSDYVMADISGFYNDINDYIFMAPTSETLDNGDRIYRYNQINADIYGGELEVRILPTRWLNLQTSYGYLVGEQDDGESLPFIPQNKLRFEVKCKQPEFNVLKNIFIKLGGVYASEQDSPARFETKTDSYFLLHAGIGTEIQWMKQRLLFSVQVNNLLDDTWVDHLSTLKQTGFYNMGRNISFNLKVPFEVKSGR